MMQSPEHSSQRVSAPARLLGVVEHEAKVDLPDPPPTVRRWDYPTHTIRPAERHE